jgi:ureidoacrylate peracid hydrolase
MLKSLAQKVSPHNAAVLVVDVQNDYCAPNGGLARLGVDMSAIDACIPRISALVDGARQAGVPVIHIRTHVEAVTESPVWMELRLRRSPDRPRWCEPNTWGADFYRVKPLPNEVVITKHRYSGFIDTNLDLILRSMGISSLIMTGVASNNCVDCTARDGFMNDYYIVFVDDCTAATNASIHAATLANIESLFGIVVRSEQVLTEWQTITVRSPRRVGTAATV